MKAHIETKKVIFIAALFLFTAVDTVYLLKIIEALAPCLADPNDDKPATVMLPFLLFMTDAPLLASEILSLLGTMALSKQKLPTAPKCCIVISTVLAALIFAVYLLDAVMDITGRYFIYISFLFDENDRIPVLWSGILISMVVYIVGCCLSCKTDD